LESYRCPLEQRKKEASDLLKDKVGYWPLDFFASCFNLSVFGFSLFWLIHYGLKNYNIIQFCPLGSVQMSNILALNTV